MQAGRNELCPCGSGKKYKKCCRGKDSIQTATAVLSPPVRPRETSPRSSRPPTPPTPPEDPRRAAIRAIWDDFHARDIDGKEARFRELLDDPAWRNADAAFELLSEIHDACAHAGQQRRFAALLADFRKRYPALFDGSAHYYLSWLIADCLASGERAGLEELCLELADRTGTDFDVTHRVYLALEYHGELALSCAMRRRAWPHVKDCADIMGWAINEFLDTSVFYELLAGFASGAVPRLDDPELLQRLGHFTDDLHPEKIASELPYYSGQTRRAWVAADFDVKPVKRRSDSDDEDEDESRPVDSGWRNRYLLSLEFLHFLVHEEGFSWTRGEMARAALLQYLSERHAGQLNPRLSLLEEMQRKRALPPAPAPLHPLCPECVTWEVFLARQMDFMSPRPYNVAAAVESVPAWLRFLERRGLLEQDVARKVRDNLRPVMAKSKNLLATHDDPELAKAVERAWVGQ